MNWLKNLKIRTKIYVIAGTLIFSIIFVGFLSYLNDRAGKDTYSVASIETYMLQARRSEKDFFARKNLKYVEEVKSAYQNMGKIFSDYPNNSGIKKIEDAANQYIKYFEETVQIEKELGLNEKSGLQGNLRSSVHSVEAIVKNANKDVIMVDMLMARRHEKDFMLRGNEKYLKKLQKAVEDLIQHTNSSSLSQATKKQIISLIKNYQKAFEKYTDKVKLKNVAQENLRNAVHKIEPLVKDVEKSTQSYASLVYNTAFIISIFALIIGIFLSYLISKLIVEPINALAEGTEAFKNGDTNVTIEAQSNDEIGQLAVAFNEMIEQIQLQISYLENLPTPVFVIDKNFNLVFINKIGQQLVDKNLEDCKQHKCYELMHADHCQTDNCRLHQAMNDKQVHKSEQIARPGGKELDIMYTGTPIVNKNGELLGALEFVADISEVKEAEKYLASSTKNILGAMEKVADGDLTVNVESEKKGDNISRLYDAFNLTVQNLRNMTIQIRDAVAATASASTQISSSAEEMAAGAQEQSSQTGEVASAMEEMTSTIVETNKNTNMAAEAVKDSGTIAKEGGEAVKNTINGMENIANVVVTAAETVKKLGADSERIGEIISVINDIADQTNLLALNAAIEAARAGEQGRGFAVVADEVRKLAERTTGATKEIAEMINRLQNGTNETVTSIEKGVEEVHKGKELAENAGKSMVEIEESSTKAMDLVTQVATASEQQSATSEEVSKNIEAINMVAQESAAGVEQIAKASEDLNRLTENLQKMIEHFKIDDTDNQKYLVNSEGNINKQTIY